MTIMSTEFSLLRQLAQGIRSYPKQTHQAVLRSLIRHPILPPTAPEENVKLLRNCVGILQRLEKGTPERVFLAKAIKCWRSPSTRKTIDIEKIQRKTPEWDAWDRTATDAMHAQIVRAVKAWPSWSSAFEMVSSEDEP